MNKLDSHGGRGESGLDVWSDYSTRDAAEFVGLTESAIRSCVRAGLLQNHEARLRFSFRDLLVLKMVKGLVGDGLSLRRARRELGELRRRIPAETELTSLSVDVRGGQLVVRDHERAWRADTGQLFFDFGGFTPAGDLQAMPLRSEVEDIEPVVGRSADDWFEHALEIEEDDVDGAIAAYSQVLKLRPHCTESLINMGRLYAETGEVIDAEVCFRKAVDLRPDDATAIYNLGVVAQDCGRDDEAVDHYVQALTMDPDLAEAHYNLATIFDRTGDEKSAIRHINEYRKLTK